MAAICEIIPNLHLPDARIRPVMDWNDVMKRLTLLLAALLGSAAIAAAQILDRGNGILEAEAVGNTDIVSITFEDGSEELYRPVNTRWDDDPVFSYRFCRNRYNTAGFIRSGMDPYVPFNAGLLAYICPGLGHVYDGEVLRGMAFFWGTAACFSLGGSLLSARHTEQRYDPQYEEYYEVSLGVDRSYATMGTVFILGGVAVWIWNICDAVKVAKVKDLYFRDLTGRLSAVNARVQPELGFAPVTGRPTAGLSLKLSF